MQQVRSPFTFHQQFSHVADVKESYSFSNRLMLLLIALIAHWQMPATKVGHEGTGLQMPVMQWGLIYGSRTHDLISLEVGTKWQKESILGEHQPLVSVRSGALCRPASAQGLYG